MLVVITVSFYTFAAAKGKYIVERGSSLPVEDDSDLLTSPDKPFTCGFYGLGKNA